MSQFRQDYLTTDVVLSAPALVPSVFAAAPPPELQNPAPPIVPRNKKDSSSVDMTKHLKHARATGATQVCNNGAMNSAREDALGGCAAILESLLQELVSATSSYPLISNPLFTK